MKIDYQKILKNNMINVFRDVLLDIEKNGLQKGHHLYITIDTLCKKVEIPNWLKEQYPNEITIVIQHEYWNYDVAKDHFKITLSFNDVKADLIIPFSSVISFADPYSNFGLKLIQKKAIIKKNKKESKNKKLKNKKYSKKNNVLEFNKFRNKL